MTSPTRISTGAARAERRNSTPWSRGATAAARFLRHDAAAERLRFPVELRRQRGDADRVGRNRPERFLDEDLGHPHAAAEIQIAVGFRQNRDPVPQPDVVVAEPRAVVERAPHRVAGIGRIDAGHLARDPGLGREVSVVVGPERVLLEERRLHRWQDPLARQRNQPWIGVGVERRRIGQMVAVVRAVGRVQVDGDVGIPAVHQPDERARFGALELHVIAVQVEPASVFANPDTRFGPVLLGAILDVDPLVAVGVVDGRDQNDELLQQRSQIAR